MARFRQQLRIGSCVFALALVASACGGSGITRDEAVTSLQQAGVSHVEATCMADQLLAQDQLAAADPRVAASTESRESLLLANQACVTTEVLPELELAPETSIPTAAQSRPGGNDDEETAPPEIELDDPALLELQRQSAISQLMSFGRSNANASCVVDQLIASEASYVLESERLGLGLDPAEAAALAACI